MATKNATATTDEIRASIHRALPGKGADWSTAKQVAEVVHSAAYSTITQHLRAMVAEGTVRTKAEGRTNLYQKIGRSPALKKTDVVTSRAATVPDAIDGGKPARKSVTAAKDGRNGGGRRKRAPLAEVLSPPVESDVIAPRELVAELVPQPPAAAATPNGGAVDDVVGFMEAARPVSAPPAEPVKTKRARRDPAANARAVAYATFGRGQLQDAILSHLQTLPQGADVTPYQVAKELNAQPGAVGYGLRRLEIKGNATMTADQPKRYAAV